MSERLLRSWGEWIEYGAKRAVFQTDGEREGQPPVDANHLAFIHVERFIGQCPFDVRALFVHVYAKGEQPETFRWRPVNVDRQSAIIDNRWGKFSHHPDNRMLQLIHMTGLLRFHDWLELNPAPNMDVWDGYVDDSAVLHEIA